MEFPPLGSRERPIRLDESRFNKIEHECTCIDEHEGLYEREGGIFYLFLRNSQ